MNSLTTDVRRRWINRAFVTCSGYIHEQEHTFFFFKSQRSFSPMLKYTE